MWDIHVLTANNGNKLLSANKKSLEGRVVMSASLYFRPNNPVYHFLTATQIKDRFIGTVDAF